MAIRNRYAEIMAQYAQSQPFSFFGYPQWYTGGYDVTPVQTSAAPLTRYEEIMAQPGMGGGGRGIPESPSAWSLLSPAERAAYYKEHPIEAGLALGAQDLIGNFTLMGTLAKNLGKDGWYDSRLEKMGVNPTISLDTQNALAGQAMQNALNSQAQSQAIADQAAQARADAASDAESRSVQSGGSGRGGEGGGYAGAPSGGSDVGRSAPGSAHYAQGGHVSMQSLLGPNPAGADDGYGALKDGEFVINDKAVKKYGIELMQAINSGKISKGKLRGLLEM